MHDVIFLRYQLMKCINYLNVMFLIYFEKEKMGGGKVCRGWIYFAWEMCNAGKC